MIFLGAIPLVVPITNTTHFPYRLVVARLYPRGFGKEHRGCKFELVWLLGEIPLEREVLFVDRTTRIDEFKAILLSAWNKLPAFSPNRELGRPELRLFQVEDSGKALQPLLAWLFAAAA